MHLRAGLKFQKLPENWRKGPKKPGQNSAKTKARLGAWEESAAQHGAGGAGRGVARAGEGQQAPGPGKSRVMEEEL